MSVGLTFQALSGQATAGRQHRLRSSGIDSAMQVLPVAPGRIFGKQKSDFSNSAGE